MRSSRWTRVRQVAQTTASDAVNGLVEITHSSVALVGLGVLLASAALVTQPQLRGRVESDLRTWLQQREEAVVELVTDQRSAVQRATAINPKELPAEQARVAYAIAKKYRVAPEPLAALVAEAHDIGRVTGIEPTLLLAIVAIESSFNPFAQSPVGAQGLMQVMTSVHSDKYESFGGRHAAFDPRSNLRVGAQVLQECIRRAGSLRGGLKHYVGAANLPSDGGYADKVMREFNELYRIAKGKPWSGKEDVRGPLMADKRHPTERVANTRTPSLNRTPAAVATATTQPARPSHVARQQLAIADASDWQMP